MRLGSKKILRALRPQAIVFAVAVAVLGCGLIWGIRTPRNDAASAEPPQQTVTAVPPAGVTGISTAPQIVPALQKPVDCGQQACLALTFDDGPSPAVTPQISATLERHDVHATFFVVGSHVPGNEELLRRMYRDGDEIGNHTWSHADLTTLPPDQILQQVAKTQAAVSGAGVPVPTLLRPPYGAVNTVVRTQVPLTLAMWNIDPEDWRSKDPKEIIAKTEAAARPGRVVDLHDIHQPTADALDQLLTDLQVHYQLVTFSQMFNLTAGQPGEFFGR